MKRRNLLRLSKKSRAQALALAAGALLSAACSVSTDGVNFLSDGAFDAKHGAGGAAGKGSGGAYAGKGSGGDVSGGGADDGGAQNHAGAGGASKGGASAGGAVGTAGALGTAGAVSGGGAVGSGGAVGTAGAGGSDAGNTYPCAGIKPAAPLIADFNINNPTDMWKDANGVHFGLYAFPDPNNGGPSLKVGNGSSVLTVDAKAVKMPAGFGVKMDPCVDGRMAGYKGVQFTISATWSGTGPLLMAVKLGINQNQPVSDVTREGMCPVPPGVQDAHPYCDSPHYDLMVPSQKAAISLDFSKFMGGKPNNGVLTDQIKNIEWLFVSLMNQPAYDATVIIDDVAFY